MLNYKEMLEGRSPCCKCVKLIKRKSMMTDDGNLDGRYLTCQALSTLVHDWPENKGKSLWNLECFAFCGDAENWTDTLDSTHRHVYNKEGEKDGRRARGESRRA